MAVQPEYFPRTNQWAIRGSVLDPTTAITDGIWYNLEGFFPFSVTVEGDFSGSAQVCVSNNPARPANTEHGTPFGSTIIDGGANRLVDGPYGWIKVRVLAITSGTVEAFVFGIGGIRI